MVGREAEIVGLRGEGTLSGEKTVVWAKVWEDGGGGEELKLNEYCDEDKVLKQIGTELSSEGLS